LIVSLRDLKGRDHNRVDWYRGPNFVLGVAFKNYVNGFSIISYKFMFAWVFFLFLGHGALL